MKKSILLIVLLFVMSIQAQTNFFTATGRITYDATGKIISRGKERDILMMSEISLNVGSGSTGNSWDIYWFYGSGKEINGGRAWVRMANFIQGNETIPCSITTTNLGSSMFKIKITFIQEESFSLEYTCKYQGQ